MKKEERCWEDGILSKRNSVCKGPVAGRKILLQKIVASWSIQQNLFAVLCMPVYFWVKLETKYPQQLGFGCSAKCPGNWLREQAACTRVFCLRRRVRKGVGSLGPGWFLQPFRSSCTSPGFQEADQQEDVSGTLWAQREGQTQYQRGGETALRDQQNPTLTPQGAGAQNREGTGRGARPRSSRT